MMENKKPNPELRYTLDKHTPCRQRLKLIMMEVREKVSAEKISMSWASRDLPTQRLQFHGPDRFSLIPLPSKKLDCLWSMEAAGWKEYLRVLEMQNSVLGGDNTHTHR